MLLKLCAYVAASAFKKGQQKGKDHKLEMSPKSCVFLSIRSDELGIVGDEFQSGKPVRRFGQKSPKEKFPVSPFCSSERLRSFFVSLPGAAALTMAPPAFYVTDLWDVVRSLWKYRLCELKSSNEESCTGQTVLFFFKSIFKKACFSSGQECTTTLKNLNCCFSPSLISGSLTLLVGSKKGKESGRTNAVVFHDFN